VEASALEELLLLGREDELSPALHAGQGLILAIAVHSLPRTALDGEWKDLLPLALDHWRGS
jgi:hypothetical protein